MRHVIRFAALGLLCGVLAGCDALPNPLRFLGRDQAPLAQTPAQDTPRPVARPGGSETEASDATPGVEAQIGTTVATLGDPTRPGLWLETPLVTREQVGRVVAENGTSLQLTLIPVQADPGAGSRLSLEAMRALGLNLTALATLTVHSRF